MADSIGTELNYQAINEAISYCRSSGKVDKRWKEDIERDYKKRK